jgi:transcriptional regulator with XRE-family HTH domain
MDAEHFAARLKEFREAAGLSQHELARRAGVSQPVLSQYESGKRKPSLAHAAALAGALGLAVNDFLKPRRKKK